LLCFVVLFVAVCAAVPVDPIQDVKPVEKAVQEPNPALPAISKALDMVDDVFAHGFSSNPIELMQLAINGAKVASEIAEQFDHKPMAVVRAVQSVLKQEEEAASTQAADARLGESALVGVSAGPKHSAKHSHVHKFKRALEEDWTHQSQYMNQGNRAGEDDCFAADTMAAFRQVSTGGVEKVLMKDLRVDDMVLSFDEATSNQHFERVNAVLHLEEVTEDPLINIRYHDSDTQSEGVVSVTAAHAMFINGQFAAAHTAAPGMEMVLVSPEGVKYSCVITGVDTHVGRVVNPTTENYRILVQHIDSASSGRLLASTMTHSPNNILLRLAASFPTAFSACQTSFDSQDAVSHFMKTRFLASGIQVLGMLPECVVFFFAQLVLWALTCLSTKSIVGVTTAVGAMALVSSRAQKTVHHSARSASKVQ